MAKSQAQMIREILRKSHLPLSLLPLSSSIFPSISHQDTEKYRRLYPTRCDPSVITRRNRHGWRCWVDYNNGQQDDYISEMDTRWDALDETLRILREDVHFNTPRHGGVDDLANQFGRWRF